MFFSFVGNLPRTLADEPFSTCLECLFSISQSQKNFRFKEIFQLTFVEKDPALLPGSFFNTGTNVLGLLV